MLTEFLLKQVVSITLTVGLLLLLKKKMPVTLHGQRRGLLWRIIILKKKKNTLIKS
jgi:hypothetical protein